MSDAPVPRPSHAPLQGFSHAEGELLLGGHPLSRVAARVGTTPFYAYDRQLISARIAELRNQLPPAIGLHYAIKANPFPALVGHLAGLVDGLDVASSGEMQVALNSGMTPAHISFAGPGKREEELLQALAAGVLIHLESFREVRLLAELQARHGWRARVAVRVNPDFELKNAGMRMAGGAKPFGVDAEQVPGLLAEIRAAELGFEGFHLFTGSQNLRADALIEAQRASFALACQLAEHAPGAVTHLNLGGGFGIPYFPGDTRLDLGPVCAGLQALSEAARQRLPDARLKLELGRYLVGEAGVYVARVLDRKISRGQVFLVTDGGLHHHLAASGNFGQVLRKNYPVAIGNRMNQAATETVSVVGPLCTPLDLLADKMPLPESQPGDYVVIFQSGAYGASASPQAFLGHPAVREILL